MNASRLGIAASLAVMAAVAADAAVVRKLPDVSVVRELDQADTVSSELLLIKLANREREQRNDILDAAGAFDATIMEYSRDAIILQLVGSTKLIDNFIDLMRDYEILESCRTGVISLARGAGTMRDGIG